MKKNEKTFEESMKRLEEIVEKLESNEVSLDDSIQLFEEGLKLVKDCDIKLKKFQETIEEITLNNNVEE